MSDRIPGDSETEKASDAAGRAHERLVIADRWLGKITTRKAEELGDVGMILTGLVLLDPDTGERAVCDMARVCWYDSKEWNAYFNLRIPKPEPLPDVLERAKEIERVGMPLLLKR